jgi:hypothetical protein
MRASPRGTFGRFVTALAAAGMLMATTASIALADPPGNNGTVKIHDASGEPAPEIRNVPHVDGCSVQLHFFFGDGGQTGDWYIVSWPPTGDVDPDGDDGTYTANSDGEAVEIANLNPQGPTHYKLYWKGDEDHLWKHKVFWLNGRCGCPCGGGGGEEGG